MRKELIEYLAALAVGSRHESGVEEADFFARFLDNYYGNAPITLVGMFRELGVLWYEHPANVNAYWREHYKSDRPNMYKKPLKEKTRIQFCREAFEFLEKETMPLSEGKLPCGIEQAIRRLLALAEAKGNEEKGLAVINKELLKDRIQLVKSLSGEYEFEYGILTDSDEPLISEADTKRRQLEGGLRQLIHKVLSNAYPNGWEVKLGLSDVRLEKIRLKMEESRKGRHLHQEYSLLDFTDLHDLITIVEKCWSYLNPWLKDIKMKEVIVFLSTLRSLRNEWVHVRRPSQEDLMLAIGIASWLCKKVGEGLMSIHRGTHVADPTGNVDKNMNIARDDLKG